MTILNKVKWISGVIAVFLVILATNLIDRNNFMRIEESVEKIYSEQLLTKDAMLALSSKIHEKEIAYLKNDSVYFEDKRQQENSSIERLIAKCVHRNNNKKEERTILSLQKHANQLFYLEAKDSIFYAEEKIVLQHKIDQIKRDISTLAEVQISKGRGHKLLSKEALASSDLFAQIELYILIVIVVAVLLIIVYPSKKKEV